MISRPAGDKDLSRFAVRLPGGRSYPVILGSGAARKLPDHVPAGAVTRCVVITDSNLVSTHADAVTGILKARGLRADAALFPAGEANKTRASKAALEDELLAMGCGRDTLVVAVGGGVTGDLAGFVAATYMRGLPWIQVPTSLLAMADASIGGKTGVDHPRGKNLIGAVHQPLAVLADVSFLATLPHREFLVGLAEIVKAGVIFDRELFEELERRSGELASGDLDAISGPLGRSIAVKVEVVSADEREADLRKILNFGHTVGHALESLTGFALTHGEAVSIGMVAEARMAVKMGLLDEGDSRRVESLLATLGLPTRMESGMSPGEVVAASAADKKTRHGRVEFVLPSGLGTMSRGERGYGVRVPEELVLESLEEIRRAP